MDVLPTIRQRRQDGLASIAATWAAANTTAQPEHTGNDLPSFLSTLGATLLYWARRLFVEARNIYWLYRHYIMKPYNYLKPEVEDIIYHSIFG